MRYRVWDAYAPGSGFASVEEMTGLTVEQENAVFFGTKLSLPFPTIRITTLSKGTMPDTLGTFSASRFLSQKLRDVLEKFGAHDVQFIAAKLPNQRKTTYFLANITEHLACLDREQSEYQSFEHPPHAVRAVRRMVLKAVPNGAPAIFHMKEIPAVILVQDSLRIEMQSMSSSPGVFTEVENFTFGVW